LSPFSVNDLPLPPQFKLISTLRVASDRPIQSAFEKRQDYFLLTVWEAYYSKGLSIGTRAGSEPWALDPALL